MSAVWSLCLVVLAACSQTARASPFGHREADVAAVIAAQSDLNGTFATWKTLHGRTYHAASRDHAVGLQHYQATLDACQAHNAKNGSFWMKPGKYADRNASEYRSLLTATPGPDSPPSRGSSSSPSFAPSPRPPPLPSSRSHQSSGGGGGYRPTTVVAPVTTINTTALPAAVDWVAAGYVTPVKDQGSCGSCWAFATAATVETINAIKSGTLQNGSNPNSLSTQQMVDCSSAQGNLACLGGSLVASYAYIVANKGLTSESNYPYTGVDGTCNTAAASIIDRGITSYINVQPNSEVQLQGAIASWGASVAIAGGSTTFQNYAGGIMDDFVGCGYDIDHAVMVVGYDTTAATPYWIVKNQWGTDWGTGGYGYLAMGLPDASLGIPSVLASTGICGMLSAPITPTITGSVVPQQDVATASLAKPPSPPPAATISDSAAQRLAGRPPCRMLLAAGIAFVLMSLLAAL